MKFLHSLARMDRLQRALCLSFVLHLALLAIRFADPERLPIWFRGESLQVILLNARPDEVPQKAQALAQTASAGGGEADQGRATSPLPWSALTEIGDEAQEREQRIEAMQRQQELLLARLQQSMMSLPQQDAAPQAEEGSEAQERPVRQQHQQLLNMLAEIEKRINMENARPKKRYISPATREAVYALYYDGLRQKIETRGTANFPRDKGQKLYGQLLMLLTVNHDGQVLDVEVVQGSGNPVLDRQAVAIAREAGPYATFDPALRASADQLVISSRFNFTRDRGFHAENLE